MFLCLQEKRGQRSYHSINKRKQEEEEGRGPRPRPHANLSRSARRYGERTTPASVGIHGTPTAVVVSPAVARVSAAGALVNS